MANTHRAIGEDQIVHVKSNYGGWHSTHLPLSSFTLPFQIFVRSDWDNDEDDTLYEDSLAFVREQRLEDIADGLEQAAAALDESLNATAEEKLAALLFVSVTAEVLRERIKASFS